MASKRSKREIDLDARIFEKYHQDISRIIVTAQQEKLYGPNPQPDFSIEGKSIIPDESTRELYKGFRNYGGKKDIIGTRSLIRAYYRYKGGAERAESYVVKVVPNKVIDDLIIELGVVNALSAFTGTRNIFCKIAGYQRIPEGGFFVSENRDYRTLIKTAQEEEGFGISNIFRALKPVITLHNLGPAMIPPINQELERLSKEFGRQPPIRSLESLTAEEYASNIISYLAREVNGNIPRPTRQKLRESFAYLAGKYLSNQEFRCIIQHDGYPWNNLTDVLVDAGDIKLGTPGLHLGCLLGHPSVYKRLEDPREQIENVIDHYVRTRWIVGNVQEHLRNSFYVGAAYGNIRLGRFNKDEKKRMMETAMEQLVELSISEPAAKEFLGGLKKLV